MLAPYLVHTYRLVRCRIWTWVRALATFHELVPWVSAECPLAGRVRGRVAKRQHRVSPPMERGAGAWLCVLANADGRDSTALWRHPLSLQRSADRRGSYCSPVCCTWKGQALITCAVKWKYCREVTLIFLWPSLMLLLCHFLPPWVFK